MSYRSNKGFKPAAQLALLLALTGLGVIIGGFLQFWVAQWLMPPGVPWQKMDEAVIQVFADPANANYFRLSQALGALAIFFLPALLYNFITQGKEFYWLGFNRHVNIQQFFFGFLLLLAANFISAPIDQGLRWMVQHFPEFDTMAHGMEKSYEVNMQAMGVIHGSKDFIFSLMVMAFLPALFEEIFFRGVLQQLFVRWWGKPLLGILVSSLLFSIVHMSIYLFFGRALLGFALGYMFYQTKNIWVNIMAHFLNNAIAVIQLYLISQIAEKPMDMQHSFDPIWDTCLALVGVASLFFLYKAIQKWSTKNIKLIGERETEMLKANPFSNYPQQ